MSKHILSWFNNCEICTQDFLKPAKNEPKYAEPLNNVRMNGTYSHALSKNIRADLNATFWVISETYIRGLKSPPTQKIKIKK